MMIHIKKSSSLTLKKTLLTWDHIPRRRKRHLNKIGLRLLTFVGCCSLLILCPLYVQAKDLDAATLKDENMLTNDRYNHQQKGNVLAEGEPNVNADKSNDNGTFKKLKPSDGKDNEEEEYERSREVIEMIQPPHTLRHQEHYKRRILHAGKAFQQNQPSKQKQKHKHHKYQKEYQQHQNENPDDVDNDDDAEDAGDDEYNDDVEEHEELSEYNRHLRYQQIQHALREPVTPPTFHHRRHEHHLTRQRLQKQMRFKWPQHHLRHQHHLNQEPHHNQPQLRHLYHEMRKQNVTTTTTFTKPKPLHQRYFDRESSYVNPLARMVTTEGPYLRHTGAHRHWKSITHSANPYDRLFGDDANSNQKEDVKRFSLSLDANENGNENVNEHENENENGSENENENINKNTNINANKNNNNPSDENVSNEDDANYDVNANNDDNSYEDDNDEDDYSYEDDDKEQFDAQKHKQNQHKYPSISGNPKKNVKRYTNPLRSLYKPSASSAFSSYDLRGTHGGVNDGGLHLKHSSYHLENVKYNSDDDDYDANENDDGNTNNPSSNSAIATTITSDSTSDESSNDDDNFSDEKWKKIEHEHYRKQLQHQRAMQILRSRRPTNENANKFSPSSQSSPSSPSTYNSAWMKRQIMNNDEAEENIYSRHYVPGTMTRKKEEELGSPAVLLESRRQYALQQRQNKALASAHHRRIITEGSCRLPQPRVERIRKDSWKIYTPHCTILHRCADDAGCCPSERQTCAPKRTKNVDLYFFVISLNETQGSIEKLTFVNHTECHCVDRSKQRAPEYATSATKDLLMNNQIPFLRRASILNCFCPNLFEKILQEDGYCRCDCSSGNLGCDWLKRGMEHFSMNDRKCILEGRCKLPTCEYGQYIKKHGRCPRREERHLSAEIDW